VIRVHRGYFGTVVAVIAVACAALVVCTVRASPVVTVPSCSFTPTQGGPGTLIHARISQWYFSSQAVEVGFAMPKTASELQGKQLAPDQPGALKPLDRPLASMQPVGGFADTTFRVPARLSSGKPMPQQGLYLACMMGGQIEMGGGGGPELFTFTTNSLPAAGRAFWPLGLEPVLSAIGVALVIVGFRLRRRLRCGGFE
jgi:hypothetical protein